MATATRGRKRTRIKFGQKAVREALNSEFNDLLPNGYEFTGKFLGTEGKRRVKLVAQIRPAKGAVLSRGRPRFKLALLEVNVLNAIDNVLFYGETDYGISGFVRNDGSKVVFAIRPLEEL